MIYMCNFCLYENRHIGIISLCFQIQLVKLTLCYANLFMIDNDERNAANLVVLESLAGTNKYMAMR